MATRLSDETLAKDWLGKNLGVSRETLDRLALVEDMVKAEAENQNLISRGTFDSSWTRHIVDSAQLLTFLPMPVTPDDIWLDLGTGAGFPGIVVALLAPCKMVLVESRTKRSAFLQSMVVELGLEQRVDVVGRRLESIEGFAASHISARAFSPLDRLVPLASRFSTEKTVWLLPKGRNAVKELETAPKTWQHVFHVEQSLTDDDANILMGLGRIDEKA